MPAAGIWGERGECDGIAGCVQQLRSGIDTRPPSLGASTCRAASRWCCCCCCRRHGAWHRRHGCRRSAVARLHAQPQAPLAAGDLAAIAWRPWLRGALRSARRGGNWRGWRAGLAAAAAIAAAAPALALGDRNGGSVAPIGGQNSLLSCCCVCCACRPSVQFGLRSCVQAPVLLVPTALTPPAAGLTLRQPVRAGDGWRWSCRPRSRWTAAGGRRGTRNGRQRPCRAPWPAGAWRSCLSFEADCSPHISVLPDCWGLCRLTSLAVSTSRLAPPAPAALNLPRLQRLELHCHMQGECLPAVFCSLTGLTRLALAEEKGPYTRPYICHFRLPRAISRLSRLQVRQAGRQAGACPLLPGARSHVPAACPALAPLWPTGAVASAGGALVGPSARAGPCVPEAAAAADQPALAPALRLPAGAAAAGPAAHAGAHSPGHQWQYVWPANSHCKCVGACAGAACGPGMAARLPRACHLPSPSAQPIPSAPCAVPAADPVVLQWLAGANRLEALTLGTAAPWEEAVSWEWEGDRTVGAWGCVCACGALILCIPLVVRCLQPRHV